MSWKMKLAGYIFIGCALGCGFVAIFAPVVDPEMAYKVAGFFALTGTGLLFGNAGKTIVGEYTKAKEEVLK